VSLSLSVSGSDLSGIKIMPRIRNTFIERDSFKADSFCRTQLNPTVSQHLIRPKTTQITFKRTPIFLDDGVSAILWFP
jgi:hypothetical protein